MEQLKRVAVTNDTAKYRDVSTVQHLNKATQPFYKKTRFQLLERMAAQQRSLSPTTATEHKLDFTLESIDMLFFLEMHVLIYVCFDSLATCWS